MNDESLRETLRTLELTINVKLDGMLFGNYLGLTPGHGSEAGESRLYVPGDDVRRIDWNVTARTRQTHVRELIADRDLEAWIAIDLSPSMSFGTARSEKRDVALGAAAAVGFLTARNQNKIGAVLAAGADRTQWRSVRPRLGRDHVRSVLALIATTKANDGSGRSDLGALAHDVAGRARRRGFVCLISDFLGDSANTWSRPLGTLAMRHDVLAIEIVDPRELELPTIGTVTVVDPATGRVRDITVTTAVQRKYADAAAAQRERIRNDIISSGAHHLRLSTDEDWLAGIVKYVDRRRRNPLRPKTVAS